MANVVVVGSQWGDEGKGKIVDWLSEQADIIVRFQGGHNAGHTLVIDGITYKLSLLPSGVVRPGKLSVIGNGVVIDPHALLEEIDRLAGQGVNVTPQSLRIAENATLILPLHQELDAIRESSNMLTRVGTTRRGIGPGLRGQGGPACHQGHGPCRAAGARAQDRAAAGPPQCLAARARARRSRRRYGSRRAPERRAAGPALHGFGVVAARPEAARGQTYPVRGRAGRAARHRPRHLSVRDLVEHGGGPGRDRLGAGPGGDRLRARHLQGLYDPGGGGAVPDRAESTRSAV